MGPPRHPRQRRLDTCITSLLDLNPANIDIIYGELNHLKIGFTTLINFFNQNSQNRNKEIASYFVSLIILQRKLQKNPDMLKKITIGVPIFKHTNKSFWS